MSFDPYPIARDPDHLALDPSDILLTGQVAVVTGGGGGIGQGIAYGLAKFGADVTVLDIDPERVEHTADVLTKTYGRGGGAVVDVMDQAALVAAIEATHSSRGRLDILVNNAGGVRATKFLEQSPNSLARHLDINLMSVFWATAAAAPLMIAGHRGGSIVNVASIEAFRAAPNFAVYSACKAGMVNFARTMAVELGADGIRVNCIAPDHTITPGNHGNRRGPVAPETWSMPERDLAKMNRLVPLGRQGVVEECAAAAVFLCSKMAAYVTGNTIHVDGGTWAAAGWHSDGQGSWTLTP